MANLSVHAVAAPSRAAAGITCVIIGMMLFVAQDGLMKTLLGPVSLWTLMAARGVAAVVVFVPAILVLRGPHRLFTPLWPIHLARAVLFCWGFSLFYAAFPLMGLAEITTIFFAAPLIVAVMAAFWLGETVGTHRIGALVIGFAGVVIAMNPTGDNFRSTAILPLLCAVFYAAGQILARKVGDRESSLTMGLYTVAFSGVLIVPTGWALNQLVEFGPEFGHLRFDLTVPADMTGLIVVLGVVGLAGYTLLSRAYQIASASLVAPFDYTYLPMATVMAWLMWKEVPTTGTLTGMALIVASGLYIGYREMRQAREPGKPAPVAEAVFAPGNPQAPLTLPADIETPSKQV